MKSPCIACGAKVAHSGYYRITIACTTCRTSAAGPAETVTVGRCVFTFAPWVPRAERDAIIAKAERAQALTRNQLRHTPWKPMPAVKPGTLAFDRLQARVRGAGVGFSRRAA